MTIVIVPTKMTSAFRIADRLAMLYHGPESQWKTKRRSRQVLIEDRQFLDRIPQHIAESESVQRRLRNSPGLQEHKNEEYGRKVGASSYSAR